MKPARLLPENPNNNFAKFEALVKRSDCHLERYWDFNSGRCDIDRLEHDLFLLAGDERILAAFYLAIWQGRIPFKQVEFTHHLGNTAKAIIREWSDNPFFL